MDSHHKNPDCAKCGNPGEHLWATGGDVYHFCRGCHVILKFYSANDVIGRFLSGELPLTKVQESMVEARTGRNSGDNPWEKNIRL